MRRIALLLALGACFPQAARDPMPPEAPAHRTHAIRSASGREAAAAVRAEPAAWLRLPAPHRLSPDAALPALREPADLRLRVGRRDERDPVRAALAWARALGLSLDAATGPDVVAAADALGRLGAPTDPPAPGDLLVFDRTESDTASDLVAVVLARDPRGVTEFIYLGGGVVRRGFVDAARPSQHRDPSGATLNTYLRTGRRWPPRGTHYLAGELLGHVVHAR